MSRPGTLLTLTLLQTGPATVIEVAGELDLASAHLLTELAESVLDTQPPAVLVLDLAKLRFFGADGVRVLLQLREAAVTSVTRLVLRDPSSITHQVLEITGVLNVLELQTSARGST